MKTRNAQPRMSLATLAVALVVGLAAASTFAHDKMKDSSDMMAKMDTNHDGMVSADEHAAYAKSMFDRMDANHDGMLSKSEMDAGMKTMHDAHGKSGTMGNDHDADDMTKDTATPPHP